MREEPQLLRVSLLGNFEMSLHGQPITAINAPRLQSLLAYLVLHRGVAQSRQQLAFTFWPDATDVQARNNLRQMFHQLRQTLPVIDQYLRIDTATVTWSADADFYLDVAEFEAIGTRAGAFQNSGSFLENQSALIKAVSLYRADLLPSCYDDWITSERERLQEMFAGVLKHLIDLLEKQRDFAGAIPYAKRLFELDSLPEERAMTLMRLYMLNGERASALRIYQEYAAALKQELGVAPDQVMREIHERLLNTDHSASVISRAALDMPSPLIGREPEWQKLQAIWRQAEQGKAQMVLVSGEAGIGKSRLAEEMLIWANQQGLSVARTRAYAAEGRLSYAPVAEWLCSESIRPALLQLDKIWLSEVSRILPELFTERPDLPPPDALIEPTQRIRFFEALARAVLKARQPLLLVLDDLQWCDQDTLEWLHYLLRFDLPARLLIIGTVRPEEIDAKHPLTRLLSDLRNTNQFNEIELKRLDAAESAKLANHILNRPVELSEATQLYADTEGNPLFVVEMARAGLGKGIEREEGANLRLPPRVQAVITARLDQLSEPAKGLMHLGAAIGRAFSFDVLVKASDLNEESLLNSLDELWQRRIVQAKDGNTYDFTHDKLREVAYAQIGPIRRRLLHRRVASAMEVVYASDLDSVSSQLAANYEQAGMNESAILYYRQAASVAQRVLAYDEVINLVNRGRSLLHTITERNLRDQYELALLTIHSLTPIGTSGIPSEERFATMTRVLELNHQLGRPTNPSILRALALNRITNGNYHQSLQIGTQLLQLAEQNSDPILLVEGYYILGVTHFWLGEFEKAREHLANGIVHYMPQHSDLHLAQFSWDPKVVCLCRLSQNLWCQGYPDQAAQLQQESIRLAQSLNHPFSLGYAMLWDVLFQYLLGNPDQARLQAAAALSLSRKHSMIFFLHNLTAFHGWAVAECGELEAGMAELQRGIAELKKLGAKNNRSIFLSQLAQQHAKLGQFDHSLDLLEEAFATMAQPGIGDHCYRAHLHCIQGDVLLAKGAAESVVEAEYYRAIKVAQMQAAKSFELHAATSLARLWQTQGKITEARNLLQPVYDWFTEGFDTHDLKDARELLDQLTLY